MAEPAIVRVRVRGIYATAITKLLIDSGFTIVQASNVIASRFNIPILDAPADVTVKDTDDRNRLLVIGYPSHVDKVIKVLQEYLAYSLYWRSILQLHSTVRVLVKGKAVNGCLGEVNGVEGIIQGLEECREGDVVTASVTKTPLHSNEQARFTLGPRVIGDYAIVYKDPRSTPHVTFSEHIRSVDRRAQLLAIASQLTSKGISVHWRSSANYGSEDELRNHLLELEKKLNELEASLSNAPPGVYSTGESIVIVELSSIDKRVLDELRAKVVPTIKLHHTLKANYTGELEASIVDYAEKAISYGANQEPLVKALVETAIERLKSRKRIVIRHVKPNGEVLEIGPAEVVSVSVEDDKTVKLTLRRLVRSHGYYDGLGVEKEPGDIIETIVDTSSWRVTHTYYSRTGEIKGRYININTPPEITPYGLRYIDLEVDVVEVKGEKKVIDIDKLYKAYKNGIITEKMYKRALEEVATLLKKPLEEVEKLAKQEEGNAQNPSNTST